MATRLQFRLHEIDDVVGGMLMLPASSEVLTGLLAAAESAPEELSVIANVVTAPPLPFIPPEQHGKPVVIALMVYAGDAAAGERAIAPLRALAKPLADLVRPMRYPEMYAGPEGPAAAFTAGTNLLVDALAPRGVEAILEHLEIATAPMAGVQLRVLGGAMLSTGTTAAAYVGFLADEGDEGVRRAYPPATLERLARVKRRYDPDNLFHLNLNVPLDA